jgi:hypothetical protein
MSNVEAVTIAVSSIAIGVAVISVILFWWYGNMQKWYQHWQRRSEAGPAQSGEAGGVVELFASSLKENLSCDNREVLETIVRMNAQTPLTSILEDPTEKFYLFEALSDPRHFPWEEEEPEEQPVRKKR